MYFQPPLARQFRNFCPLQCDWNEWREQRLGTLHTYAHTCVLCKHISISKIVQLSTIFIVFWVINFVLNNIIAAVDLWFQVICLILLLGSEVRLGRLSFPPHCLSRSYRGKVTQIPIPNLPPHFAMKIVSIGRIVSNMKNT